MQYPCYVFANVYFRLRVVLDKTVLLNTAFNINIKNYYNIRSKIIQYTLSVLLHHWFGIRKGFQFVKYPAPAIINVPVWEIFGTQA